MSWRSGCCGCGNERSDRVWTEAQAAARLSGLAQRPHPTRTGQGRESSDSAGPARQASVPDTARSRYPTERRALASKQHARRRDARTRGLEITIDARQGKVSTRMNLKENIVWRKNSCDNDYGESKGTATKRVASSRKEGDTTKRAERAAEAQLVTVSYLWCLSCLAWPCTWP